MDGYLGVLNKTHENNKICYYSYPPLYVPNAYVVLHLALSSLEVRIIVCFHYFYLLKRPLIVNILLSNKIG